VIDCRLPDDSDSDEEDAPTSSKEGISISGAAGDTGCAIAIDAKPVGGWYITFMLNILCMLVTTQELLSRCTLHLVLDNSSL
jgi:nicotinamide mononucleotide (NMN) deamidase PncC